MAITNKSYTYDFGLFHIVFCIVLFSIAFQGSLIPFVSRKLKMIDEIFESEEIRSEIRKNNINQSDVSSIKATLKNKLIGKRENMSEIEIKNFIKTALDNLGKEQKKAKITKEKEK